MSKLKDTYNSLFSYYRESELMRAIEECMYKGVNYINKRIDRLEQELFVSTAVAAIDRWEKDYGITSNGENSVEIRRANVIAKRRGMGTATPEMIIGIIRSYTDDEVSIIEKPEEYIFEIHLNGKEASVTLYNIMAAVEEIKPAHLAMGYTIALNINGNLHTGSLLIKEKSKDDIRMSMDDTPVTLTYNQNMGRAIAFDRQRRTIS